MVGAGVVAELAAHAAGIVDGVVAGDAGAACGGKQQRGENFQQRGFARAVGTQQRDSFTCADFQGDAGEGHGGGRFERLQKGAPAGAGGREEFGELFDVDRRFGHGGFIACL